MGVHGNENPVDRLIQLASTASFEGSDNDRDQTIAFAAQVLSLPHMSSSEEVLTILAMVQNPGKQPYTQVYERIHGGEKNDFFDD